jgi:site-specific recombinase XerD
MQEEPLSKLLPKFIDSLKTKGRSPATILAYRADLEQLVSFLTAKNKSAPKEIEAGDLEEFKNYLLQEKYTPKSTSRKLNAIKTFFRWLKDENAIATDPSKDVVHPKIENSLPKFLSQLEYRALRDISRTDTRIAAIIELILQTGMRISEVANLKTSNIKGDEITIESYATQPQRTVPLNQAAKESLENYLRERPKSDSPFIFVSKNGKALAVRNIRASIDRYMQKAEIGKFSVNDLRTTFIVENLRRGVDLVTISQAAGHKRLSTTERYLELAKIKETGKKQKLEVL